MDFCRREFFDAIDDAFDDAEFFADEFSELTADNLKGSNTMLLGEKL